MGIFLKSLAFIFGGVNGFFFLYFFLGFLEVWDWIWVFNLCLILVSFWKGEMKKRDFSGGDGVYIILVKM